MKRSSLPLVLLVLLAGAVFFYFRSIQPGDLAALADDWNLPAMSARNPRSAPDPIADDFNRPGPQRPTATARPAAWPTDRVAGDGGRATGDGRREPVAPDPGTPCEGAEILARVGNDVILAREVSMGIAEFRAINSKAPADAVEQKIRENMKKQVAMRVEEKLVCLDAQRKIPKDNFKKFMDGLDTEYEKRVLPDIMKKANIGSRRELEQKLRESGVTLEIQKRAYIEANLAYQWMKSEVKPDEEISLNQLLTYYREHEAEFVVHAPLARWEQLMVRTSRFPGREAAYAALAEMGNQVLDGVPLAQVAKARSQGTTADKGGLQDWTGKGSLASRVLDEAIFTLPIGRLSPILEDRAGLPHRPRDPAAADGHEVLRRRPGRHQEDDQGPAADRSQSRLHRQAPLANARLDRVRQRPGLHLRPARRTLPVGLGDWGLGARG